MLAQKTAPTSIGHEQWCRTVLQERWELLARRFLSRQLLLPWPHHLPAMGSFFFFAVFAPTALAPATRGVYPGASSSSAPCNPLQGLPAVLTRGRGGGRDGGGNSPRGASTRGAHPWSGHGRGQRAPRRRRARRGQPERNVGVPPPR